MNLVVDCTEGERKEGKKTNFQSSMWTTRRMVMEFSNVESTGENKE